MFQNADTQQKQPNLPTNCPRYTASLAISDIKRAVVNIILVVTSPHRERVRSSRTTLDSERQEENKNLGSAIHSGGHEVVPLDVLWPVLPQVVLAEDANDVVGVTEELMPTNRYPRYQRMMDRLRYDQMRWRGKKRCMA